MDDQAAATATIGLDRLVIDPCNPRQVADRATPAEVEALDELTGSIESADLLQPLIVRPRGADTWGVICGSRRLAALRALGRTSATCVIREDLDDAGALALGLAEHAGRRELNPIEQACAYEDLLEEHGWSKAELSRRVGVSVSTINTRLRLLTLPPGVQDKVAEGRCSIARALRFSSDLRDIKRTHPRPTARGGAKKLDAGDHGPPAGSQLVWLPEVAIHVARMAARTQGIDVRDWLVAAIRAHANRLMTAQARRAG